MRVEKDFAEASLKLKISKIENSNILKTTNYHLYFNRQIQEDEQMNWFCLVEYDAEGNNVKQFDFDDLPRSSVVNMIKQMINVLKADLK